jgi:hypothetical protein
MLDNSEIRAKRERARARNKRWRAKHRDAWNAYVREYRKRPKSRAREKTYFENNRERINAQRRAHRLANLEAARAKARFYRRRKSESDKESMAADPSFVPHRLAYMREYAKKWRAANPEKCREYGRRARIKRKAKCACGKRIKSSDLFRSLR